MQLLPLAILLFICSTWFVVHYAKKNTSIFVIMLSILSFGSGLAAVPLLPIDLSYASLTTDANNATSAVGDVNSQSADAYSVETTTENPTYIPWQVTYWTTFLFAWFILPVTREMLHSGHFGVFSQLIDGISTSLRSIGLMIVVGVVFVIGMAVHMHSVQFKSVLMPVIMAWGNTYGLVLVSLLLGNGLISIPKKYWREAHPGNELRRIRIAACGAEEELFDAVMALEDVEQKIEAVCAMVVQGEDNMHNDLDNGAVEIVQRRRQGLNINLCSKSDEATQFNECLELLVKRKNDTLELNEDRRTERVNREVNQASLRPVDMDINYLVELNAQLKTAQEQVTSQQLCWDNLMDRHRLFSALTDDGIENCSSDSTLLLSSASSSNYCFSLRYHLERLWIRHMRYYMFRIWAIITGILSVCVLLGEVTLAVPLNLSPFSWILHALDHSGKTILFQITALVPLLYMSICVYTCLFQLSLLGPYRLRGNGRSPGVALVFNAQFLVRLQFSLAYNFLLILKYDAANCAFHTIMSDMSTIPFFGSSFTVYGAPLIILAVCVFSLCDAYPKMLHMLGIEHEDTLFLQDQETLDGRANEGIQLLKRETEKRTNDSVSLRNNAAPKRKVSPDKVALVQSSENDNSFIMDGACKGRYSNLV